jgi:cytoskeleton protein RodZ
VPYDLKRIPRQAEPASAEAARLGEELREARLALGHSVEEMGSRLRIRRQHLEALEEVRLGDLPGLAYAVGFVRSYAAALGLDGDDVARRYRDAAGQSAAQPKLVFPEPLPERGMPAGTVLAVGAVVAVGAYVAWFNLSGGGQRSVDVVPPVPPRLERAAEQGRAQLAGRAPDAGALPPGGTTPPPAASGANTSAQAATVPVAPQPAAAPPAIPGMPEGTRVVLRARAGGGDGAWVQVRDPRSGTALLNRVLRPGEAWPAPVRDGLLLDTGKAEGLEILLDGQPQPTLEGLVGVRRNIALEPERLRQRLAPAGAAATPAAAGR